MSLSTEAINPGKKQPTADAPVRKFMFEHSFENATVVHRAPERKPVLMKPEQIDALKKESHEGGFAEGKSAGQTDQNNQIAALLGKVEENIAKLIENVAALQSEYDLHARQLALAIAKKVLPTFTAQNGMIEIETLINETIREMGREPRLVVRVNEGEFDTLNEKIQEIATKRAYSGKVIVLADPQVASGNCRIEWPDGGVERNVQATTEAIEKTVLPSSQ